MATIEPPARDVNPATITPDKIHTYANLFPGLTGERAAELRADIKARGQIEPVVFHQGILLDGRHRVLACKDLGINVRVVEFSSLGLTCTPEEYIESTNLFRRHLTEDQRVAIAFKFSKAVAAAAKENQKRKPANSVLAHPPKQKPIHTRKTIAERAKSSEHKVRQMENVEKHAPHLAEKVTSGAMKLKDAAKATKPKTDKAEEPFHILIATGELRDGVHSFVRERLKRWPSAHRAIIPDLLRAIANQLEVELTIAKAQAAAK